VKTNYITHCTLHLTHYTLHITRYTLHTTHYIIFNYNLHFLIHSFFSSDKHLTSFTSVKSEVSQLLDIFHYFCPILTDTETSGQIVVKISNITFHENAFNDFRFVLCGQRDRLSDINRLSAGRRRHFSNNDCDNYKIQFNLCSLTCRVNSRKAYYTKGTSYKHK